MAQVTRKGWTLRLGRFGTYRLTRPSRRVRIGREPRSVSFGWLIVTRIDRFRRA